MGVWGRGFAVTARGLQPSWRGQSIRIIPGMFYGNQCLEFPRILLHGMTQRPRAHVLSR